MGGPAFPFGLHFCFLDRASDPRWMHASLPGTGSPRSRSPSQYPFSHFAYDPSGGSDYSAHRILNSFLRAAARSIPAAV